MTDHADPTIVARTERVLIRPWRMDEADRLYDTYRRQEVTRWLGGKPMADRREAVELIERRLAGLAAEPRFGSWAVVERSSGIPAGGMILKALPDARARSRSVGISIRTAGAGGLPARQPPRSSRTGSPAASRRSGR